MMYVILNIVCSNLKLAIEINSRKKFITHEFKERFLMNKYNYALLSERGVVCYIFMCIEKYLQKIYPQCDWKPVAKNMWELTDHWWDEDYEEWFYFKVVPSYILQFDSFKDACIYDNVWRLTEEDYKEITSIYRSIERQSRFEELDWVFDVPLLFMGIVFENDDDDFDSSNYKYIVEIENILLKYDIELPDYTVLEPFKYEEKKIWIPYRKKDTTVLSIIL